MRDAEYLNEVERAIKLIIPGPNAKNQLDALAASIAKKIEELPIGRTLLIPGGWSGAEGGHAMIYQFTRTKDGYEFAAINSGAGIVSYHAKKSIAGEELYNPMKIWAFPLPDTSVDKGNLNDFIAKLLQARMPVKRGETTEAMSETILYHKILPDISYIHGEEINANDRIPAHAYTAGQLSGTCAQRCIPQMLKIHSPS